jgi:hypothetical protein
LGGRLLQLGDGSLRGEYPGPEDLGRVCTLTGSGANRWVCWLIRGAKAKREREDSVEEEEEEEEEDRVRLTNDARVRRAVKYAIAGAIEVSLSLSGSLSVCLWGFGI